MLILNLLNDGNVPGELFCSGDLSRRQKRFHNSDINLNVHNSSYHHQQTFKRQKSSFKYRQSTENSSIVSLPSLFSSTKSNNDSTMTLVASAHSKRILTDEAAAADADDEKEIPDESIHFNRHHRYHHQLSTSSHYRLNHPSLTSEDDDEELLSRNHHGMMDFMDRVGL